MAKKGSLNQCRGLIIVEFCFAKCEMQSQYFVPGYLIDFKHIAMLFACKKNVIFTCLHGTVLMNLGKNFKELMKKRWGEGNY